MYLPYLYGYAAVVYPYPSEAIFAPRIPSGTPLGPPLEFFGLQLFAGQDAGIEAAIHVTRASSSSPRHEGHLHRRHVCPFAGENYNAWTFTSL